MRRAVVLSPLLAPLLLGSVAVLVGVVGGAGSALVRQGAPAAAAPVTPATTPSTGRLPDAPSTANPSSMPIAARPAGATRHKRKTPAHLLLQRQVVASLAELRSRVARCDDRDTPRASDASRANGDAAPVETVLVLEIELLDGQIQIVDAPVQTAGSASSAFLTCARSALRGQILPARGVKAGERIRLLLGLGIRGGVGSGSGSSRSPPEEAPAVIDPTGIEDSSEIDPDSPR